MRIKEEFESESEANKIVIANGEFGDAVAMITRYGGTDRVIQLMLILPV